MTEIVYKPFARAYELWVQIPAHWRHEAVSTFITFWGIFTGALVGAPAINAFVSFTGLNLPQLPSIQQIQDVMPIVADTLYRSLLATLLMKFGLRAMPPSKSENTTTN